MDNRNRLTFLKRTRKVGLHWYADYRCECGNIVECRINHVERNATRSCGCLAKEVLLARSTIHGSARRGKVTPEFTAWVALKGRCYNVENTAFKYYGGRGIKVCDRWLASFEAFFEDMGPRPSAKHSIDRKDVNGNYEPSNCRWATKPQQAHNTTKTTLSDDVANLIRNLASDGVPKIEISRILSVNYSSVKQVAGGHQWKGQ